MTIIGQLLAAWLTGVIAGLSGQTGPAPQPAPEPDPVVEIGTPVVEYVDTLAEDEARVAPYAREAYEAEDGTPALVVLWCAPHIASDPVLAVQFGCADALIQP